jgi:putative FmdB family regulatory protein
MPTYEYLCQTCSHRFETWQKMTDEPLTTCPECGAHIRRVLYPAGVVFKGSGFYKTDHGSTSTVASDADGNGKKATSTDDKASSAPSEGKASSESSTSNANAATDAKSSSAASPSEKRTKTPATSK